MDEKYLQPNETVQSIYRGQIIFGNDSLCIPQFDSVPWYLTTIIFMGATAKLLSFISIILARVSYG